MVLTFLATYTNVLWQRVFVLSWCTSTAVSKDHEDWNTRNHFIINLLLIFLLRSRKSAKFCAEYDPRGQCSFSMYEYFLKMSSLKKNKWEGAEIAFTEDNHISMLEPCFCLVTGGNIFHMIFVLLFVRPLGQELSHPEYMLHLGCFFFFQN